MPGVIEQELDELLVTSEEFAEKLIGDVGSRGCEGAASARKHSFSIVGMEDDGRRDGKEKACILLNMSDAYGKCGVALGTVSGLTFGYCFGDSGAIER